MQALIASLAGIPSTNGKAAPSTALVEVKDAAPVIDASALRYPQADFWPINNRQGTIEVRAGGWYAASWLAYSCMRYRATKLIEPPLWVTVEQNGEEAWVKGSHPIEGLLQQPNPDMTLSDLLELTSLYLDSTPGCVWHKVRDRAGRVARLYPYSGDEFEVESARAEDGTPRIYGRYRLTFSDGRRDWVQAEDVVHFRNANPGDLLSSLPPLNAALLRLRVERELEVGILSGIRNTIRPGSSIRFEGAQPWLNDQAKLDEYKAKLAAAYESAVNRGKALVTGAATYTTHELGFDGLAGGELTMESEAAVCAVFTVPPAVVGARIGLENSSDRHNMETAVAMFYDNMAFPTWSRWEDVLTLSLLREFDSDPRHFLRFDKSRVRALKEDIEDKAATVEKLREDLALDERRALLGYPPATPEQRAEIEAARATANPFAGIGKALGSKTLRIPVERKISDRETLWKLRDANVRGQELAWEIATRAQLADDKAAALRLAHEILKPAKAATGTPETKGPPFSADPETIRALIKALAENLDIENAWSAVAKTLTSGTAKRAVRAAAAEVGVSFDLLQPGLSKYVAEHAAELVQGIADTTRTALRDTLQAGLEAGEGIPELTKRIEESGAFADSRAELIARTETTTVTNNAGRQTLSTWAAENDARVIKTWLATKDSRTREAHAELDGEERDIDKAFSNGLQAPGEPNCFIPGTLVEGAYISGLRAEYLGEVLVIRTAGGRELTVTPNHPILTPRGFVAAKMLGERDHVLSYAGVGGGRLSDPDEYDGPAAIEEVFGALAEAFPKLPSHARSAEHLHGDALFVKGDIDVVGAHRVLLLDGQALTPHVGGDGVLMLSSVIQPLEVGEGTPDLPLEGINRAAPGLVGRSDLPRDRDGIRLQARPLQALRVSSAADLHTSLAQPESERCPCVPGSLADALQRFPALVGGDDGGHVDGLPSPRRSERATAERHAGLAHPLVESRDAHAAFARELLDRFPALIAPDEIIEVERRAWAGHVYDLQSVGGWNIANGILTSNCRCSLTYSIAEE